MTVSEELRRSLICQVKEQNVPAICKISGKIYFFCVQSGEKYYLSGPVCVEQLSYVEIHQFYKKYHMSVREERHPGQNDPEPVAEFRKFSV